MAKFTKIFKIRKSSALLLRTKTIDKMYKKNHVLKSYEANITQTLPTGAMECNLIGLVPNPSLPLRVILPECRFRRFVHENMLDDKFSKPYYPKKSPSALQFTKG